MKKVIKRGILEHPRNNKKFLTYTCGKCQAVFKTNEYVEEYSETIGSEYILKSVCPMCGHPCITNKVGTMV